MIFETLTLHNFGIYGERQSIDLAPRDGRAITLIGALNGGGKTTILEALQIVLYGRVARCVDKRKGGYIEYLQRAINRNALAKSAQIELSFAYRSGGRDHHYTVTRTWSIQGAGVSEKLDVCRDGVNDPTTAERWSEFVEALIPSQISDLFFFDGERIESLADPERSAELVRVGVHSLLGLDLCDDLSKSLVILERRMRAANMAEQDRAKLQVLTDRVTAAQRLESDKLQRLAATRTELEQLQGRIRRARERFESEGGALYEQRDALAKERYTLQTELEALRARLREYAAGVMPLALLLGRLMSVKAEATREREGQRTAIAASAVEAFESRVLLRLQDEGLSAKATKIVETILEEVRARGFPNAAPSVQIDVDPQGFEAVIPQVESQRRVLREALRRLGPLCEEIDRLDRKLAAIPDESKISALVVELNELSTRERDMAIEIRIRGEEYERLGRERRESEQQLERLESELVSAQFEERLQANMRRQLLTSRRVLTDFRQRMRVKHVGRLETLVSECFANLLRKREFVDRVTIDPESFSLTVRMVAGGDVPAERLSAGERQLLAVAILWALARASGRKLPTIVDTPLGRLDSKHRDRLVMHYFPFASHQVVLLSTDEEIVGRYHEALRPAIAREYLVQYDEQTRASRIREGYFERLAEAA